MTIYNALKEDGYNIRRIGFETEFRQYVKDIDNAIELYNDLQKNGFAKDDIGTEDDFLTYLGLI